MVCGLVLVTDALCSSWSFRTGWSLLFTMKACGQTMFMISWRTNSEAAEVLMLNPARFSSSAMVAVPPLDDDASIVAPLAGGASVPTVRPNAAIATTARTPCLTAIRLSPMVLLRRSGGT